MTDTTADYEEIVALSHRNRIAIWTRDLELWETCFVHAPYTTRWGWWQHGGIFVRRSWDELSKRVKMEELPRNLENAYETKVTDLSLQIRGDMAWATYVQEYPCYYTPGHVGPGIVHEVRIFERHDGAWKIAFLGFLDGNSGPQGVRTVRLAVDGRVLWQSPAAAEALADSDDLTVRNGSLRFRDHRLDRQLQDALKWVMAQDVGLMSTQAARPIVADAGLDQPPRVYWVMLDAGMLFLTFGETRVSEDRLEFAAAVYSLSEAQKRVAALIAEGLALPEIAERRSITPHTARTHLNRIFDKTGVRTQPALVRVLLTAVAPV
ncbi:MAG TPA: helix-turn-helix transcriptional regulator [Devosia sp.]